jgi:hypothetical protein
MANGNMKEATAVIDGVTLTNEQVMTLRVAVSRLVEDMAVHGALGCDGTGELLRVGYWKNALHLRCLLMEVLNGKR